MARLSPLQKKLKLKNKNEFIRNKIEFLEHVELQFQTVNQEFEEGIMMLLE